MKISIVVCLVVVMAPTLASQTSDGSKRVRDKEDVQAAVIRYQMEGWYRGGDESEAKAKRLKRPLPR